jgi:AcrR family transcriptional regulator
MKIALIYAHSRKDDQIAGDDLAQNKHGSTSKEETTRQTILRRASALFASGGFDHLSMRALAADIGVTPAALYHHFTDKEALYTEVLERLYRDVASELISIVVADTSPRQRLREYITEFAKLCFENPDSIKMIKREQMEADPERLRIMHLRLFNLLVYHVSMLIKQVFPQREPLIISNFLHGMILHHYEGMSCHRDYAGWEEDFSLPQVVAAQAIATLGLDD